MCGILINQDKYFFLVIFIEAFLVTLDIPYWHYLVHFSSSGFALLGQFSICCSLLPCISNSSVSSRLLSIGHFEK